MGWNYLEPDFSPRDRAEEREEIRHICCGEGAAADFEMIDAKCVGTTWYAAVRVTPHDKEHDPAPYIADSGGSYVMALVILTERSGGSWGYKDMPERHGPNRAECPASLLSKLSPLDPTKPGYAQEWRDECLKAHDASALKITPGSIPDGAVVTLREPVAFEGGFSEQTFTVIKRLKGKRTETAFRAQSGILCRLNSQALAGAEIDAPASREAARVPPVQRALF